MKWGAHTAQFCFCAVILHFKLPRCGPRRLTSARQAVIPGSPLGGLGMTWKPFSHLSISLHTRGSQQSLRKRRYGREETEVSVQAVLWLYKNEAIIKLYSVFKILSDFLCGDMLCLLSLDHFSHSDSAPVAAQRRECTMTHHRLVSQS